MPLMPLLRLAAAAGLRLPGCGTSARVKDSMRNVRAAKAIGMGTVLIAEHPEAVEGSEVSAG